MKHLLLYCIMSFLIMSCSKTETIIPTSTKKDIQTIIAEEIDITYAKTGGIIDTIKDSVLLRGLCWGTSPNPSFDSTSTKNGSGVGIFRQYLFGLKPETKYYVRAYYKTSSATVYGNEIHFTTYPNQKFQYGQKYKGGIIYFIGSRIRPVSYITVEDDSVKNIWNNSLTYIGANDNSFTNGLNNTNKIVGRSSNENAAVISSQYFTNNSGGWHLPSVEEMVTMSNQKEYIGKYNPNEFYWTSTEKDNETAWAVQMGTGEVKPFKKNTILYFKPIKYF